MPCVSEYKKHADLGGLASVDCMCRSYAHRYMTYMLAMCNLHFYVSAAYMRFSRPK